MSDTYPNDTLIDNSFKFLCLCCKTVLSPQEKSYLIQYLHHASSLQKKKLLILAQKHAVIPLVYKTLRMLNIASDVLSAFKQYYMHTVQTNMLMSHELIHLVELLKKHQIEVLSFKGATLAQSAYDDITLRQFGDIDILIHKQDRTKVFQLLDASGYLFDTSPDLRLLNTLNVLTLYTPSANCVIEIHWELVSKNYAVSWDESLLWRDKQPLSIHHTVIETLGFESYLLYLCLHGSKHLFERFSWVCDIDRIVRMQQHIDWDRCLNSASKLGILHIFLLSLSLAHTLLDLPLPSSVKHKITNNTHIYLIQSKIITQQFHSDHSKITGFQELYILYRIREKAKDKLLFLWYAAFAPTYDDIKNIRLPSYLFFLYPILRPLRLLKKYF